MRKGREAGNAASIVLRTLFPITQRERNKPKVGKVSASGNDKLSWREISQKKS